MSMTLNKRDWIELAACRDVPTDEQVFFPQNRKQMVRALNYCNSCPVSSDCLRYAMENDIEFGVWGGTTETERKRLRYEERLRTMRESG